MSSIPDEVYREILLRVPVKSTFVCKTVCKNWYALISNPDFAKSHLNHAIANKNTHLMFSGMVIGELGGYTDEVITSIAHDSLLSLSLINPGELVVNPYTSFPSLSFCFQFNPLNFFSVVLSGSCDGLLCLWCTDDNKELYILWNPATSEYKETPSNDVDYDSSVSIIAFGYDPKSDDYKLLQGRCAMGENYSSSVEVYSLRRDLWETVVSVPYSFTHSRCPGVLVNGAFHWLGKTCDENLPELVIGMDISDVEVRELQLPKEPVEKKQLFMNLGELDGCLCVLVDVDNTCFEVWVMQEYGVAESWAKRYIVNYVTIASWPQKLVRLILTFKNGEILFGTVGHDPILYDPKNGNVRELSVVGLQDIYEEFNYFESLVTLNSGTYVDRRMSY